MEREFVVMSKRFTLYLVSMLVFACFVSRACAAVADVRDESRVYWEEPPACLSISITYNAEENDTAKDCRSYLNQIGVRDGNAGHHRMAIARFTQILRMYDNGIVYSNRGISYAQLNMRRSARLDFMRSIALMPNYAAAWSGLAKLDMQEGRHREAIRNISQAIFLRPYEPEHYELRAEMYAALGKKKLARIDRRHAEAIKKEQTPVVSAEKK